MSELKIVKLSESGLQPADKLSKCLPPDWLAYSNFEFRNKSIGNREIDLVLITPNAILLIELKNWNGRLRSEGRHWILNGQDRGESPVAITNRKSQSLKSLILEREKHNVTNVHVAPFVVLCGSAGPDHLSEEDRGFVSSLEDFCNIGKPNWFKRNFPNIGNRKFPLNREKELFNRLFCAKNFDPRKLRYQGYVPEGASIFSHQDGLYHEFIAEQDNKPRFRALLRTWDLQSLPPAYGTLERWREVVERETSVIGYAKEVLPWDFVARTVLTPVGKTPEDEFTSKYFELYELPPRLEMIEAYVYRNAQRLPVSQRLHLASLVLSAFSEFHQANVAHRDISSTCVWTGDNFAVSISRWLASTYPEGQTVGPVREFLRSGRSTTPEDKLDQPSDPFRRDVFLLGALVYFLVTSEHPPLNDGVAEFQALPDGLLPDASSDSLSDCLEVALSWEPSQRYANATELNEAFQAALDKQEPPGTDFRVELSSFLTDKLPYVDYPIERDRPRSHVHTYESVLNDQKIIVKVWLGLKPVNNDSAANHRLLQFLATAKDINRVRPAAVQEILDYGISSVGTFLVVGKIDGESVADFIQRQAPDLQKRLRLSKALLEALSSLHSLNVAHGDIKPENVFVSERKDSDVGIVKFIDCPDLDVDGQIKDTPTYSLGAPVSLTGFEKDRYAMLMTICQVLGGSLTMSAGVPLVSFDHLELEDLEEEINRRFRDPVQLLAIDSVESHIDDALAQIAKDPIIRLEVPLRNLDVRTSLFPDDDLYVLHMASAPDRLLNQLNLSITDNRYFQVSVAGVNGILRLVWDDVEKSVVTGYLDQDVKNRPKGSRIGEIRGLFVFVPAHQSDFSGLAQLLADALTEMVDPSSRAPAPPPFTPEEEPSAPGDVPGKAEATKRLNRADIEALWLALIDAETDVLPELTVSDQPDYIRGNPRRLVIPYESKNGTPIEFERNERVAVEIKGPTGHYFQIGTLVGDLVTNDAIVVDLVKGSLPSISDTIRLNSAATKASHYKRRIAIERLISSQSVNPTLFDWLAGISGPTRPIAELDLDATNDFCKRFRLNESQCQAIWKTLNLGPVGLVQGPPGTGKTYFIAVLVYRLLSEGADNILLTSQSHEAVNNAIEKISSVYSDDLERLDLVRVGPLSMCSAGSAHYHIDNIQHRYRKRFESDVTNRIIASAKTLGLPPQFISQYVKLSVATRALLEEFEGREEDVDDRENDPDRVRKTLFSIRASIYGRALRISTKFAEYTEIEEPALAVSRMKHHLTSAHRVTNSASVERLEALIQLSFDWIHALISPHGNFGEFLTRTKRIVCGTCVGVGRRNLNITNHSHEWVIIDEAARCSAGELAVPAQTAQRLVLVGDHKQLPPMYTPDVVDAAARRLSSGLRPRIEESDFRRAVESEYGGSAAQLLHKQYRMKSAISDMVSDVFYEGQLETSKEDIVFREGTIPSLFEADVIWCDTASLGKRAIEKREILEGGGEGSSFVNLGEVRKILEMLKVLEAHPAFIDLARTVSKQGEKPIGVICTYAGQKRELLRQLRQRSFSEQFFELIKIDTVDSYQGKENLIIILSLVRNNGKKNVGFLGRDERVNVAISRAMERLIIVGSSDMWASLETPPSRVYRYIKERSESNQSYGVLDASTIE
jgi:serine/threonine protein kinase